MQSNVSQIQSNFRELFFSASHTHKVNLKQPTANQIKTDMTIICYWIAHNISFTMAGSSIWNNKRWMYINLFKVDPPFFPPINFEIAANILMISNRGFEIKLHFVIDAPCTNQSKQVKCIPTFFSHEYANQNQYHFTLQYSAFSHICDAWWMDWHLFLLDECFYFWSHFCVLSIT